MSDSEKMGRCYNEMKVSRDLPTDHLVMADAIDRLAADVAAVMEMTQEIALRVPSEFGQDACDAAVRVALKERDAAVRERDEARAIAADVAAVKAKVDAVSPEDVRHFVEAEKAWVKLVEEQRDAAIRERDEWREEARLAVINRDEARAEVERLNAELAARPAVNSPEIPDSSPAVMEPAQDASEEIAELKFWVEKYRVKAEAYGGMVRGCSPALERAGHPVNGRGPDGAVGGIARAVEALICERDEARAEADMLKARLEQQAANPPAAPPPGWLTERERRAVAYFAQVCRDDLVPDEWTDSAGVLRSLLARAGSPPVVEVPKLGFLCPMTGREQGIVLAYRDALDAAGVKWKEVGRE